MNPVPPEEMSLGSTVTDSARASRPYIPDHQLLRCIGAGSYGEVWLARSVMGTYRAVKIVYRRTFEQAQPYEREFKGIQKFEPISRSHDSQVDILHVGRNDTDGYFFYIMELADDLHTGQQITPDIYFPKTLKGELAKRGRLPFDECLQIGLALTKALEHLHENKLVHRDIKPSNIVFINGAPKLADIGLVAEFSEARSFVGTTGFIPPEGPGTAQADLYSLGKVLYEISFGHKGQSFPDLPPDWDEVPEQERLLELNEIILKACESDLRVRYKSASDMHADLLLLEGGKSVKRLRLVERRLVLLGKVSVVISALLFLAAFAYFGAVKQTRRAERAEQERTRQLYVSEMNLAQQAWDKGNIRGARELLKAHRPGKENREDLRGFEWFYFWQLCYEDKALHTFQTQTNSTGPLALSSDGNLLAIVGEDSKAILWDLATHTRKATLTARLGWGNALAFSPDSRLLAFLSSEGTVQLWDRLVERPAVELGGHNGIVTSIAFSRDGKMVATGCRDNLLRLWDVSTGHPIESFTGDGQVFSVAFSPDGKTVAAGNRDNTIKIWNIAARELITKFEGLQGFVWFLAFSPDGRTLASAGDDSVVVLWDLPSKRRMGALRGHENDVLCAVFSPDGQAIATGSNDETVKLWDVAAREEIVTLKGHLGAVTAVAFAHDGATLVSASNDGITKTWDIKAKQEPDVLKGHTHWARSVLFTPNGKTLASCSRDMTIRLWEVASGKPLARLTGHERPVYRLAMSPDGKTLASVSGLLTEPGRGGEVNFGTYGRH